jgi:hypothetical protein
MKKGVWIGIIAGFVLIAAVIILGFFMFRGGENTSSSENIGGESESALDSTSSMTDTNLEGENAQRIQDEQSASEKDYPEKMQEINNKLKIVYDEYSLTSRYLNYGNITPEESIKNYELHIQQFKDIQNEIRSITPPDDMQEYHQNYLDALDLFIESCNLFIREIKEEDPKIGYDAAVIHNQAFEVLPKDVGRFLVFE